MCLIKYNLIHDLLLFNSHVCLIYYVLFAVYHQFMHDWVPSTSSLIAIYYLLPLLHCHFLPFIQV